MNSTESIIDSLGTLIACQALFWEVWLSGSRQGAANAFCDPSSGKNQEAISAWEEVLGPNPPDTIDTKLARIDMLRLSGKISGARHALDRLIRSNSSAYISPFVIAQNYAALRENDLAFEWLSKAVEQHDPDVASLGLDAAFDALHSDPRYHGLRKKVGLEEQ